MNCINKNHPDVIKIAKELELPKAVVAAKIGVWQTNNNITNRFPSKEELLNDKKESTNVINKINKISSLRTFDFNDLEGKPQTKEVNSIIHNNILNNPDKPMADHGESFNEASNRTISTLEKIIKNGEPNSIITTHNSVFGLLKLWDEKGRPNELDKDFRKEYVNQDNTNPTGSVYKIQGDKGDIYLVRHGETEDNVSKVFRTPTTKLTANGENEATNVGKQLKDISISHIYTSDLPRAVETSNRILNEQVNQLGHTQDQVDQYKKQRNNIFTDKRSTNAKDALEKIANSSTSYNAQLAKTLIPHLHNNTTIELMSESEMDKYVKENGRFINNLSVKDCGAFYDPNENKIIVKDIATDSLYTNINHEILHALTYDAIHSNSSVGMIWNDFYNRVLRSMSEEEKKFYQFTNSDEFLAGLSNPQFLKFLASKPSIGVKGKSNLFVDLVNFIKTALSKIGIEFKGTLLEDFMNKAQDLLKHADTYSNFRDNRFKPLLGVEESPNDELKKFWEKHGWNPNSEQPSTESSLPLTDNIFITDGNIPGVDYSRIEEELFNSEPEVRDLISKQISRYQNLIKEINTHKGINPNERAALHAREEIIKGSINRLLEQPTIDTLYAITSKSISDINRVLTKSDLNSRDLKDTLSSIENISKISEELQAITNDKNLVQKGEELKNEITKSFNKWKDLQIRYFTKEAKTFNLGYSPESFRSAVKDINDFTKNFLFTHSSDIQNLKMAQKIFDMINRESLSKKEEYDNSVKELESKLKNNPNDEIKKLLDKDGQLFNPISKSYYDTESNILQEKSNIQYNKEKSPEEKYEARRKVWEWYLENNDYTLSDENLKAYNDQVREMEETWKDSNGNIDPEGTPYIEQFKSSYDPVKALQNIKDKFYDDSNDNWFTYLTGTPKDKWKNPNFTSEVENNPLYQHIVNTIIESHKNVPHRLYVDTGNYSRLLNNITFDLDKTNKFSIQGIWSSLGDKYDRTLRTSLSNADISGKLNPNIIVDAYGNEKPILQIPNIDKIKQNDIMSVIEHLYYESALYANKSKWIPTLELLQKHLATREAIKTNKADRYLMSNGQILTSTVEGALKNAQSLMEHAILSKIYNITKSDQDKLTLTEKELKDFQKAHDEWQIAVKSAKENGERIPPEPTLKKYSMVKAVDAIIDYTRLTQIGLNPFSGISNLIFGITSNSLWAARNRDFTDKEFWKSTKIILGAFQSFLTRGRLISDDFKKMTLFSEKFGIEPEKTGVLGESNLSNKFVKLLYSMQTGGEFIVHTQGLVAKLYHEKLNIDGKKVSLYDCYKIDGKDGNEKLVWDSKYGQEPPEWKELIHYDDKGNNISKLSKFWDQFEQYRRSSQGDYFNAMQFKGKWYGRALMMFRTWIPQAIEQRFGSERDGFKGRYRSYRAFYDMTNDPLFKDKMYDERGQFIDPKFKLNSLVPSNLLKGSLNLTNYFLSKSLIGKLSPSWGKGIEAKMIEKGLTPIDIENMRVNMRELHMIVGLMIMAGSLQALMNKDKQDSHSLHLAFALNLLNRANQDLSFFYSPTSTQQIMKDVIPIMATWNNASDVVFNTSNIIFGGNDIYKNGPHKGGSKLIHSIYKAAPITHAIQTTFTTANQVFGNQSFKYSN